MAVLILNIAFLIINYILLFALIESRIRFTNWLYGKIKNRFLSVIWPFLNAIFFFIFFTFGWFLITVVTPNLFSTLGSKLVPDYFVGARLYSIWWWLLLVILPILIWIAWREIFYKTTPPFEIKGKKKGILLGLLIAVILISVGYIAYTDFLQSLQSVTPGKRIEENILVDNQLGYSITLYPRNGTWKRQIESLSLPSSENGYNLRVYIGQEKLLNGQEYFYNEPKGFLPLKPEESRKIEEFSSNNINWFVYRSTEKATHYPELEVIGRYQEKIVIIFFNYEDGRFLKKSGRAEADFKKMVRSFKLLDYSISTRSKQEDCASLTLPKYKLAKIGDWGSEEGKQEAEVKADLDNDGNKEIVRVYNEKANTRTLPVIIKVLSGDPPCLKEEFNYGEKGELIERTGNEIGSVKVFTNFWGDGRDVVMFNPINTGYGSGFTQLMNFLTFRNGKYQVISGPTLSELTFYKFLDVENKGKQILVADAKSTWEVGEGHFSPHRYNFERWDWNGNDYTITKLGKTQNKYDLSINIEEIIQVEPEVLISE